MSSCCSSSEEGFVLLAAPVGVSSEEGFVLLAAPVGVSSEEGFVLLAAPVGVTRLTPLPGDLGARNMRPCFITLHGLGNA
ncbi:unnamed protein product [Arctogadus glacialis]